ncbi:MULTISPECIES: 3-deoxy-manno-octulosonate cytidylyltransferase [Rhodomicrobium]|uniref:3-deoxy-manno-octulosonate cytidylyltransferase n=1 Tax=Rhodomicrobium TaxID=1068 RepID=UPI000B4BE888|nr:MULTISPECIES: 3-deoxy-manno-octulosonate cytidylyltransferase [Rhodomicrobium]
MARPLIVIPSRIGAARLPRKPLADIAGEPMIVHVWRRAMEAEAGDVVVATDAAEIAAVVEKVGGRAVMTRADHPSGSDRVYEAAGLFDPSGEAGIIVNVQGDQPALDPALIRDCLLPLADPAVDIATLATPISDPSSVTEPSVVKLIGTPTGGDGILRALYFTRAAAPFGAGPLYHHIGLYAYRRAALARFVALPPSTLELREKLEQLRALEAGMRIDAKIAGAVPMSVDTPDDLEKVRAYFAAAQS